MKKIRRLKVDAPPDQPPDRTTMKMRDLVRWNPSSNPMKYVQMYSMHSNIPQAKLIMSPFSEVSGTHFAFLFIENQSFSFTGSKRMQNLSHEGGFLYKCVSSYNKKILTLISI